MDKCFSVYPKIPPWYTKGVATELCPSKELCNKYKNYKISSEDFVDEYYYSVLEKLNPQEIAEKYDGAILLGWYKLDNDLFVDCRKVISFWLGQYGIETRELTDRELKIGLIL